LRGWTGGGEEGQVTPVAISLRLRLVLLPALIVLAGVVGLALFEARDASSRVRAETASGVQLGRMLGASAIGHAALATTPEAALASLRAELPPAVRHVQFTVQRVGLLPEPSRLRAPEAPAWFVDWVDAPPIVERYPVTHAGVQIAAVTLTSTPADEIDEVWADWRNEMALLAVVSIGIIFVVVVVVNLALRPLSSLAHAFDRMEEGDFAVRAPASSDPQLRQVVDRFNSLAASLEQATADNRRLLDRLMSVQEEERKDIAHELHDEFGPSLFAIRADLGAISRWVRKKEPRFEEIQERALSISGLVAQIQRINSRLLERLRPLVLEQMPLGPALESLISDWRNRYPNLTFELAAGDVGDPGEAGVHALYRAAQECLTNVVRHAEAKAVRLRLERSGEMVVLTCQDDGRGMAKDKAHGFGLLGMAERARAAGGRLEVSAADGGGMLVQVSVRAKGGGQ